MFCAKCGKQIINGQAFCSNCGSKTGEPARASQPSAAPPPQTYPMQQPMHSHFAHAPAPQKNKRTGLYIGIGIGGALLVALLIFAGIRILGNLKNPAGTTPKDAQITAAPEADAQLPSPTKAPSNQGGMVKPKVSATPAQPKITPALLELADILPGKWASLPDQEYSSYIYAFTADGLLGNALAFSDAEETLNNWGTPGVWDLGEYDWDSWRIEGNTVVLSDTDGDLTITVTVKSRDHILISYPQSEPFDFYRVGDAPTVAEYLVGTWVPDEPDKNGIYAAFTFGADGSANLTGATKAISSATAQDWGAPYYWTEVDGSRDGDWHMSGEGLIISMQGRTDSYRYEIDGANHCTLYYGESWQMGYTRVTLGY